MHGAKMPVPYGYTAPLSWGRRGLGEAFGRHGLIVFCVHLRYNTLTIDSTVKRVFILAKIF